MKASDKTNPALLIDADQLYEVDYTIDQSGKKHYGKQMVKGGELTEPQIKEIVRKVDLSDLFHDFERCSPTVCGCKTPNDCPTIKSQSDIKVIGDQTKQTALDLLDKIYKLSNRNELLALLGPVNYSKLREILNVG